MHPTKLLWFICTIVAVSLLLTACAPVAAPSTQAPAPAAANTAAPPPAPSAAGKWCDGVRIVYASGQGPAGGVFSSNLYNGAKQAATDMGAKVDYIWSDWDPQKAIQQFKEAVATKPDGIVVIGIAGDEAMDPLVEEAVAQGIQVTTQTTPLPNMEAKYSAKGFGYVGQELYQAGYNLAKEAVKRGNLKAGDRSMVWGLLAQPTRGERTKGAIDALKEAGLTVDYIEIDAATNADPPAGVPTFTGYASSHPDVKLIITDHGGLTATVETYLKAANKGPNDVYAAGFDLSTADLQALRNGFLDLVIDQQPWLQGYLAIQQICMTKKFGFSGLHIDTGAGFVGKDDVEFVAPLVEKVIR